MVDGTIRGAGLDSETELTLLSREELEELVRARTQEIENVLDTMADVLIKLDSEARIELANESLSTKLGYDIEAVDGKPIEVLLSAPDEIESPLDTELLSGADFSELLIRDGEVADIQVGFADPDGEVIPMSLSTSILRSSDGKVDGYVCVAKDISERIERERLLEEKNAQLEASNARLEYERDLKEEIRDTLINTSTRGELEQAFCNSALGERRVLAWVSEETGPGTLSMRTTATADDQETSNESYLQTTALAERVLKTGVTAVENDLAAVGGDWAQEAFDAGLRSGIAIPLVHNELTYGVFGVFATEPDEFQGQQRALLEDTAESLAYSIHAAVERESLRSEQPMRVVFELQDDASYLPSLANGPAGAAGSITVNEVQRGAEDAAIQILSLTNVEPTTIHEAIESHDTVLSIEAIGDVSETNTMRATVELPTVQCTIAELGGAVRSTRIDNGLVRVVCEFSRQANIERVLSQLQEQFPDTELVSRTYVDRTEELLVPGSLDLTEKQFNALRTAFASGFFNRPQQATANNVAETLGVARTTFLQHLRAGELKLLEGIFGP